ncbi:U3 small nucleolar RNA-associated protein [Hypoxylon texense]
MIVKLVVLSNAVSFFGKDLAKDDQFMISALAYVEETLICAEIVRLLPNFIAPIVGGIMALRLKAHQVVFDTLLPVAQQRCQERDNKLLGQEVPYHADCIQWIMETSPKQNPWTAKRVVHELMAIWFGSVHALSTTITFAIHDLCLHPEYILPLREELLSGYQEFENTSVGLPLLDSFIKESARLTPVESMSTRRSALVPFTLSDGTRLQVNEWACTPVRAIMSDPRTYPAPLEFHGFRFASVEIVEKAGAYFQCLQAKPSKFTDLDSTFHVWGTGRMACPGRYYATAVIKVIMGQIIMNYNLKLANDDAPRWFTWRSSILPRSNTMVVFSSLEA